MLRSKSMQRAERIFQHLCGINSNNKETNNNNSNILSLHIFKSFRKLSTNNCNNNNNSNNNNNNNKVVTIGDVTVHVNEVNDNKNQYMIPLLYADEDEDSQETLKHLRWLMQKHLLRQDVFLIGPPGPNRRRLAYAFAELLELETEYLAITRDTTEADLKQRREIKQGNIKYVDQSPVTAAINGRLLIIDGIEKAERNVLPTLNNLLENREMSLDDGRFLVNWERYQSLLKDFSSDTLKNRQLIPVHRDFRVIALGLPVPRFQGYPLDPPLRSRFQALNVAPLSLHSHLKSLTRRYENISIDILKSIVSFYETLKAIDTQTHMNRRYAPKKIPLVDIYALDHILNILSLFHDHNIHEILFTSELIERIYPFTIICDDNQTSTILQSFQRFNIPISKKHQKDESKKKAVTKKRIKPLPINNNFYNHINSINITQIEKNENDNNLLNIYFNIIKSSESKTLANNMITILNGGSTLNYNDTYITTTTFDHIFFSMIQDHACNRDFALIGAKGCGKSALAKHFCSRLGYGSKWQVIHLFRDMSSRDLLQRRTTDSNGNTRWEFTPLIKAAINGEVAILDGLDRLPASTLSVLQTLLHDRELKLFDGTRLISYDRYNVLLKQYKTKENLEEKKIYCIHPAFRIIGLGLLPDPKKQQWLIEETLTLFSFHLIPSNYDNYNILCKMFPSIQDSILLIIININDKLQEISKDLSLSLRQFIRILRRYSVYSNVHDLRKNIERILLYQFLPIAVRQSVEDCLNDLCDELQQELLNSSSNIHNEWNNNNNQDNNIFNNNNNSDNDILKIERIIENNQQLLKIGTITYPIAQPKRPELVPEIFFVDIQKHLKVLEGLLMDLNCGEKHLLLIGNQGVGKNKLADRLLQILQLEREYMQLHRDSTVQQLTVTPALRAGIMYFEDSPLVKAVIAGRVLVIDEADKAPLEVVSILKGLVEDGEMELSDGRRIVRDENYNNNHHHENIIQMHPNFRVIILANRPGYPFLGNDFFRECGDVFSCHVVSNPDRASEIELLRSYGPNVASWIIEKLVDVFGSLRRQVEEGVFTYPYSTRELVNIIKHLQQFPNDGLLVALENVLHFDVYDSEVLMNLHTTFRDHGLPLNLARYDEAANSLDETSSIVSLADTKPLPPPKMDKKWRLNINKINNNNNSTRKLHTINHHSIMNYNHDHNNNNNNNNNCTILNQMKTQELFREMRQWDLDLGRILTVETWKNERFSHFTEQKYSWKIQKNIGRERLLGMTILSDDTIHILQDNPLTLLSFSPSTQYRHYSRLHLDDFLPVIATEYNNIFLHSLRNMNTIIVYVPFHSVMLLIKYNTPLSKSTSHSYANVKMISLPPFTGEYASTNRTDQFLKYISPGFKFPRSMLNGMYQPPTSRGNLGEIIINDDLIHKNILYAYAINDTGFTIFDFNKNQYNHVSLNNEKIIRIMAIDTNKWYIYLKNGNILFSKGLDTQFSFYPIDSLSLSNEIDEKKKHENSMTLPTNVYDNIQSKYIGNGLAWLQIGSDNELSDLGLSKLQNANKNEWELMKQEILMPSINSVDNDNNLIQWKSLSSTFVKACQQLVVTAHPKMLNNNNHHHDHDQSTIKLNNNMTPYLCVIDFQNHNIRHMSIPIDEIHENYSNNIATTSQQLASIDRTNTGYNFSNHNHDINKSSIFGNVINTCYLNQSNDIVTLQDDGTIRIWQIDQNELNKEVQSWRRLFGVKTLDKNLRLEIKSNKKKDATAPKHGKVDKDNKPHVGGNQWAGGTGGADTAGLGGKGGPYRLDAGHNVHQMSDEEKSKISEDILKKAREIAQKELANRLKEIDLSTEEDAAYQKFLGRVSKEVSQLRLILESVEAKAKEREWLRHQTDGDIDDNKLVDGVTGDKQIYRRRGIALPKMGLPQRLPKRLHFLLDISGSMYRFNGYDHRLDRLLETALLIMESLEGFDHKFQYTLVGHSGDGARIPLVPYGKPPINRKERLKVLMRMHAHAQYCSSGDHTLESVIAGVQDVAEEEADDHLLFLVSDANLKRYAINPVELQRALTANPKVNAFAVFIASLGGEAEQIIRKMQPNHAYNCEDVGDMPHIFTQCLAGEVFN